MSRVPLPALSRRPGLKICGLTRVEDARLALQLGADFLGLILTEKSPRFLTLERAMGLLAKLRAEGPWDSPVRPVGVLVDRPRDGADARALDVLAARLGLFAFQLHGTIDEAAAEAMATPVIRALAVRDAADSARAADAVATGPVLLDTFVEGAHGGTGKVFDHALALPAIRAGQVLIAGGLNPANIVGISSRLAGENAVPYAYDISSGLEESPGIKSAEKMRTFVAELREE